MSRGPKTTLTLQSSSETITATGLTATWSDVDTVKGNLRALKASERLSGEHQTVYATHRFTCRPVTDTTITEKYRFTYGSRIFDIEFVDDLHEQGKELQIDLLEVT